MYIFSGNIVVSKDTPLDKLPYDHVVNLGKDGQRVLFVFGETQRKNSEDLVGELLTQLSGVLSYDISHSGEQKMDIVHGTYEEGVYEVASFEGEAVDYEEIKERFENFEEAVAVREAQFSEKFGNRIVKVDFVY